MTHNVWCVFVASSLLDRGEMTIYVEVFTDAAHVWIEDCGCKYPVGWFQDEVSAISAANERVLIQSAILPELRRLPELRVVIEYRASKSGHRPARFFRGLRPRNGPLGRRMVLVPWGALRPWLGSPRP